MSIFWLARPWRRQQFWRSHHHQRASASARTETTPTDLLNEYITEADEGILLEIETNLWHEERTNLAKFCTLTIHLNGSNAHFDHNADFNKPLVELGQNFASEHPDIFVNQEKFNINNLREWSLDLPDDYGLPRHILWAYQSGISTIIAFLHYSIRTM